MTDLEKTLLESVPTGLYIAGEWIAAEGDKTFEVRDPATNDVVRTIADASPADGMLAGDGGYAESVEDETPSEIAARIPEPEYTGHEAVDAGLHPDVEDRDPPGPDSAGNEPSKIAEWGPEK